jgi:hypothetical protein
MREPDISNPGSGRHARHILAWIGSFAAGAGAGLLVRKRPKPQHIHDEASGRGDPGEPPSPQARKAGHEVTDMSGRTMMWVLICLAGSVAGAVGVMFLLLNIFQGELREDRPQLTAEQTAPLAPPDPTLEAAPETDLARLRGSEDHLLHAYSWIDAHHTRARIPIDRAMTLVTGQKLDVAP